MCSSSTTRAMTRRRRTAGSPRRRTRSTSGSRKSARRSSPSTSTSTCPCPRSRRSGTGSRLSRPSELNWASVLPGPAVLFAERWPCASSSDRRSRLGGAQRQDQSLTHRFLHERGDPRLFGGGQLCQREGGRPHGLVEGRLVAAAERRVPRLELCAQVRRQPIA